MTTRPVPLPAIGDYVRVQLRYQKPGQPRCVSVVSGTVVEQDWRTMGFTQFRLDNGWWFSPDTDYILEHRPNGDMGKMP